MSGLEILSIEFLTALASIVVIEGLALLLATDDQPAPARRDFD